MLRWVIWLLVLANAGYFAWTQGYLAPLGLVPQEEREPERLQAQIQPDTLRLLNAPRSANTPTDDGLNSSQTPATAPADSERRRPKRQAWPKRPRRLQSRHRPNHLRLRHPARWCPLHRLPPQRRRRQWPLAPAPAGWRVLSPHRRPTRCAPHSRCWTCHEAAGS